MEAIYKVVVNGQERYVTVTITSKRYEAVEEVEEVEEVKDALGRNDGVESVMTVCVAPYFATYTEREALTEQRLFGL
jgi:hypothetical protein